MNVFREMAMQVRNKWKEIVSMNLNEEWRGKSEYMKV